MSQSENQKIQLIKKIADLSAILGVSGSIHRDEQSLFIAHSTLTVLKAGEDAKHSMILLRNLNNFIDEVSVADGKKSLGEFMLEKISAN